MSKHQIHCENCDGQMTTTGETLPVEIDGHLRQEIECVDCGATSAILHDKLGHEILEAGAYAEVDVTHHPERFGHVSRP